MLPINHFSYYCRLVKDLGTTKSKLFTIGVEGKGRSFMTAAVSYEYDNGLRFFEEEDGLP